MRAARDNPLVPAAVLAGASRNFRRRRGPDATVSRSPSTPTTRTMSPACIGSAAVAVQISPCVATRPVAARLDRRQRLRHSPSIPASPGDRPAPLGLDGQPDEEQEDADERERHRDDQPQADLQLRQRRVDQHHRAEEQADDAADREQAVARDLHFEDQQNEAEQDQQDAGSSSPAAPGTRRTPAAGRCRRRRRAGRRPGSTARSSGRACRASAAGRRSAGCAIALSTRCAQVISIVAASAPAVCSVLAAAVEALDRPAIELPQQIGDVVRDQIDQRRRGASASCSVNDRLSVTACSTSATLRLRCVASVRA